MFAYFCEVMYFIKCFYSNYNAICGTKMKIVILPAA